MKPIIIVMLLVDAAMLLTVIYSVVIKKPSPAQPEPLWRSLAISLLVAGMVSERIGESHTGTSGAELLQTAGMVLLGMAVMSILVSARKRRGTAPVQEADPLRG
jgi:hypothetical protein